MDNEIPEQLLTETPPVTPVVQETRTTVIPSPSNVEVVAADYVKCDFCDCKLTTRGHVYEISDKARDFRDGKENHRKEINRLNEQISALNHEISVRDAKIRELMPKDAARSRNFL